MHNILAATSGVSSTRLLTATAGRQHDSFRRTAARVVGFVLHSRDGVCAAAPLCDVVRDDLLLVLAGAERGGREAGGRRARVDLRPSALRHAYNDAQIKVVKYYDNIRFVYEIESKVRELKRATTPAEPGPEANQKENHKNDTSGQPDQRQDRNYSQEYNQPVSSRAAGKLHLRDGDHEQEVCMNCANHADASAVAYCRTCGKALCANCTRPVRGVIYCEDCLGAKMEGSCRRQRRDSFPARTPAGAPRQRRAASASRLPAVAADQTRRWPEFLPDSFPFGVGAVYTGPICQGTGAPGHLRLADRRMQAPATRHGEALGVICGFGIAFFYRLPDHRRGALGARDPDGAADSRSLRPGGNVSAAGRRSRRSKIPMGAIVLILIGVLFLLHTLGLTEFGFDRFWPLILIGLGGWLFARN